VSIPPPSSRCSSSPDYEASEPTFPAQTKRCTDCAETIQADARKCRFCGFRYDEPTKKTLGREMTSVFSRVRGPRSFSRSCRAPVMAGIIVAAIAVLAVFGADLGRTQTTTRARESEHARGTSARAVSSRYTIHGTFTLIDYQSAENSCIGTGGFDDISDGTQVVVTNTNGTVIGQGSLESGSQKEMVTCVYDFTVSGLPRATFYGVTVSHRGEQNYSFERLAQTGWKVRLDLSSPD
jgi:hypothetical protein